VAALPDRLGLSQANSTGVDDSADAVEQLGGGGELETSGEDHERLQARRALAPLQEADLSAMQVARFGERLLREPRALPVRA
jgi:hypothetical protein